MRAPKWKIILYSSILLFGIISALPNIIPDSRLEKLPDWFPKEKVTLGLDLRGGSHMVLEVDSKTLIKERLENLATDARTVLQEDKIAFQNIRSDNGTIIVSATETSTVDAIRRSLRKLDPNTGGLGFGQTPPELNIQVSGNDVTVSLTEAGITARINSAVEQSLEIVRRRIDQIGVSEPTIQRVGADRILVQLPGLQDPTHLRQLLGSTAKMTFHLLDDSVSFQGGQTRRRGVTMLPDVDGTTSYPVRDRVMLGGDRLTDAQAGFNPQTNEPVVSFRFDGAGARQFARITRENVGKPFAIVLDGKVLSAPVIREPITGGQGQISGNFSVQEASTLSALLRAGALPAPLTVIEERTVGPDLGGDAIEMGLKTGLIGFALVFGFIMFLYGRWGLIANFALALNIILTFGALSLLGATLTLPGIAGIILGIGLAVDANVLINERIREEVAKGRRGMSAVEAGFDRAYATIVDSNVTALIATILLFQFGTGPVKGFAVTMALGIGISMFTAVSVVKIIMQEIVRRYNLKEIRIKPVVDIFPHDTKIQFMKARFWGIGVSLLLSAISIGLFINPGLNYGVDFKGGIQMEASFDHPVELSDLRSALEGLNMGEIGLQEVGNDNNILLRAERQEGGEEAQTIAVETIKSKLNEVAGGGVTFERTEVVGPKVSGELAQAGILSVILASICMLFYIWWRFEWPFAVGAIVTLVLDITKTVGFFALTGLDFNLTAIAAILTLVGYSVNDKVVVYDRMRENMRLYKKMPLREMIDKSINETLGRSLYTSITAFLAMLPMAIWGGSAVSSFAIPMVFGIVIAASSSVFIAAPILLFLGDWRKRKADAAVINAEEAA